MLRAEGGIMIAESGAEGYCREERGILKFEGECWCAAGGIMMAEEEY
jgi:hypothetical protein